MIFMIIKLLVISACATVHVFGTSSADSAMRPCAVYNELSEKEYCDMRAHLLDHLKSTSGFWLYLHSDYECPYEDTLALELSCSVPSGQKAKDINTINPQDSTIEPKQVLDMLCREAFKDEKYVFDLVRSIVNDVVYSPSVFDNIDTLVKFVGLLNGNCSCISVPKIFIDGKSALRWFLHLDFAISARCMFKLDNWRFQDLIVPKLILDYRLRRFDLEIISFLDCDDWALECLIRFSEPQDFFQRTADDIISRIVNVNFDRARSPCVVEDAICKIRKYYELHESKPELCLLTCPSMSIDLYGGSRKLSTTNPETILLHKHIFPALQKIIYTQLQQTLDQEVAKLTNGVLHDAIVASLEWMSWMVFGMDSTMHTCIHDNPYIQKRIYKVLCQTADKYVAIKNALMMLDRNEELSLSKDSLSLSKFNSKHIVQAFVKSRPDAHEGDENMMKILRGVLKQQ